MNFCVENNHKSVWANNGLMWKTEEIDRVMQKDMLQPAGHKPTKSSEQWVSNL